MKKLFLSLHLLFFSFPFSVVSQVIPLPNAHSHNDYKQQHPLNDAMNCGFTSFEADVFLRHDSLIVAHLSPLFKTQTLETLYLKPLYDSVLKHGGTAYYHYNHPVILLVDIKTNADETYLALKKVLEKYSAILSRYKSGKTEERAVTVILSGNRPFSLVKNENDRFAFIDENLIVIGSDNFESNYSPLASTKYSNVLHWKGNGIIPKEEERQLISLVTLAHMQGKKVRLWASPENKEVWKELLKCSVDQINTDELVELKDFLLKK
jgi:hypothetical protein